VTMLEPKAHCQDRDHRFLSEHHGEHETKTWLVVGLTATMMVVEIVVGYWTGSMALLAVGFHMATHAGALLIAALTYRIARRWASDPRFTFGTGKLSDLGGFSSALLLGAVAVYVAISSVDRLLNPVPILYTEALVVASVGLVVNLVSAWLLHHDEAHGHETETGERSHAHTDHNLRGAYLHVVADALTSILAIAALLLGRYFGWTWCDPAIGIAGAVLIGIWALGLARSAGAVLLDASADAGLDSRIRRTLAEGEGDVYDFHLWRVAPGRFALIVGVESASQTPAEVYKRALAAFPELCHVTVEVHSSGQVHQKG
jgi:cation diffusion facilitator family transporter